MPHLIYFYGQDRMVKMVKPKKILTGKRFGHLVVAGQDLTMESNFSYWICKCDCGNEKSIRGTSLLEGKTISCGCIRKDRLKLGRESLITHGGSKTRLYKIYRGIIDKTEYPSSNNYSNYGARGIKMCEEWRKDFSIFRDWALSHGYADNLSIDRIDNSKGYEPSNCRWATAIEQAHNKRPDGKVGHRTFTEEQKEQLRTQRSGALSSSAKLKENEAAMIRILGLRGFSNPEIRERFPMVSLKTISNIVKGETWKVLPMTIEGLKEVIYGKT